MSMLNLEKRQRVLEEAFGNLQGMVAGLGTDLGDFIDEMSGQVHSLRGEVTHRVESHKNDIGGIETSMTMQVQGVGTQIGDLIRMLSCLLGSNKTSKSQPGPTTDVESIQSQISSSREVLGFLDKQYIGLLY